MHALAPLAALVILVAACDGTVPTSPPASPTPAPAATGGPAGMLHMTAEPGYDYRRAEIDYVVGGERIEGESIDQDVEIIVNRAFPPGSIQVIKNDIPCDGSIEITSGMETDVLLDFGQGDSGEGVCELFTRETHPTGSIQHPELPLTSAVGAFLPFGMESVFVVRSLDAPEAAPIAEVTVDDPPYEAEQITVQPGRYETSVLIDGVVIARMTVDLERGEDRWMPLRVLPPDVPRDCGETPEAICRRVINAGYMWGLFPGGREYVTAATVRPSDVMSCGHSIESPLYSVVYQMANPSGESDATVGRYPDGRYTACSY